MESKTIRNTDGFLLFYHYRTYAVGAMKTGWVAFSVGQSIGVKPIPQIAFRNVLAGLANNARKVPYPVPDGRDG
jgi:hypothetical protein